MDKLFEFITVLLLISNLFMLATSRLKVCINTVAFQGILVGILSFLGTENPGIMNAIAALTIISIKGILFPVLLNSAMDKINVKKEIEPFISYTVSVLIGIAALGFSFWLCKKLEFPGNSLSDVLPAAAVFSIFTGIFMIVSRIKAITQVVGYICFENGIFALGTALMLEQSLIIELGILLDVFVVVFIMGIVLFHISREFDHIDTNDFGKDRE